MQRPRPDHLLSLAAGALLGASFAGLLPEAFESDAGRSSLFGLLLATLVGFFLFDKMRILRERQQDTPARRAWTRLLLCACVIGLGGPAGWWADDGVTDGLPYLLVIASGSFIYVALADLVPQLHRHLPTRDTAAQIACLLGGIGMAVTAGRIH
jgi:zinc transporter ZupT